MGFGHSDRRPAHSSFNPQDRQSELLAVLETLHIPNAVLVAHDAPGLEALDFALDSTHHIAALVLLNTYYGRDQSLHFPEMIALMSDPEYRHLVDAIMAEEALRLWLLAYTAQRFGLEPGGPDSLTTVSVLPSSSALPTTQAPSTRSAPGPRTSPTPSKTTSKPSQQATCGTSKVPLRSRSELTIGTSVRA